MEEHEPLGGGDSQAHVQVILVDSLMHYEYTGPEQLRRWAWRER